MSEPYSLKPLHISEHEEQTVCSIQEELIGINPELAKDENANELEREAQKLYATRFEQGDYDGEFFK